MIDTIETMTRRDVAKHNGLAAIDASRLQALRKEAIRNCFQRLEDTRYRMEPVCRIRGREYINDAASRNVNATWYALESTYGSILWIANGSDENIDYSKLADVALRKVHMLLVVGGSAESLRKTFTGIIPKIEEVSSMAEALRIAYYYDNDDIKVLYSPACSNEIPSEVLGEMFRREVNEL